MAERLLNYMPKQLAGGDDRTSPPRAGLPRPIRSFLRGFILRRKLHMLLDAVGLSLGIFLAWLFAECLLDRWARLPRGVRLASLIVEGSLAGGVLLLALARLLQPVRWLQAAASVERRRPEFGERLITVVSYAGGKTSGHVSPQMIEELMRQVMECMKGERRKAKGERRKKTRIAVPIRIVPWLVAFVALVIGAALWPAGWLGLGQLLKRGIFPWADVAAVTLTHIDIEPRGQDVMEGQTVTIRAIADRFGSQPPVLQTSTDGSTWTRLPMLPSQISAPLNAPLNAESASGSQPSSPLGASPEAAALIASNDFTADLQAGYRDIEYRVTAGDAQTPVYTLRVKRPPSVTTFEARYDYPPYLNRPPLTLRNADGLFEAPVNTLLTLKVSASEPLAAATLGVYGKHLALQATGEASVWTISFVITHDSGCSLDMISTMGMDGHGPLRMRVEALTDRPPTVQLLEPREDLIVLPRQTMKIRYAADDPYSITHMALGVQVNGYLATSLRIAAPSDLRHVEGQAIFDLASANVRPGDVVALTLRVEDPAGQTASSQQRYLIVSTVSGDVQAEQCAHFIEDAAATAGRLQAPQQFDLLRRQLLAAQIHCYSTPLSQALLFYADRARAGADFTFSRALQDLAAGTRARILLSEWDNLAALTARREPGAYPRGGRQAALVEQLRQRWVKSLSQWGIPLNPHEHGQKLDAAIAELQQRVAAADGELQRAELFDPTALIRQLDANTSPQETARRLSCAAQAACLRAGGDALDARQALDWQLLAGAVAAAPPGGPGRRAFAARIGLDAQAMFDDELIGRYASAVSPLFAAPAAIIARRADAVRDDVRSVVTGAADKPTTAPLPESAIVLAMSANWRALCGDDAAAQQLGQRLTVLLGNEAMGDQTELVSVREIDRLIDEQSNLALPPAADARGWRSFARGEQAIADELAEISQRWPRLTDPNHPEASDSRHRALATVAQARGRVAGITVQVTNIGNALRQVRLLLDQAEQQAAAAGRQKENLRRADDSAQRARDGLMRDWDGARSLGNENLTNLIEMPRTFAPETSQALEAIDVQLRASLYFPQRVHLRNNDISRLRDAEAAMSQWLSGVKQALAQVNHALDVAEQSLADEDPAAGAAWFASSSASVAQAIAQLESPLATSPATQSAAAESAPARLPSAEELDLAAHGWGQSLAALRRFRSAIVQRQCRRRLAATPQLAGIFELASSEQQENSPMSPISSTPRDRTAAWVAQKAHQPAPAGFGEAIRAYFNDLEQAAHQTR